MASFKKVGNRYEIKFKRKGKQRKFSVDANNYSKRALMQLQQDMNQAYSSGAWKLHQQSWQEFILNPGEIGLSCTQHQSGYSVEELLQDYLKEIKPQIMELTYTTYANKYIAFIRDNGIAQFDIKATDSAMWTDMLERYIVGKSQSYQAAYKSLIPKFMAYVEYRCAYKLEVIKRRNFKMSKRYSGRQTELVKYLTHEQLLAVFKQLRKRGNEPTFFYYADSLPYDRKTYVELLIAIYELIYYQSMRYVEFKRLRLADIDLEKNTLKLHGKGMKTRIVPITKNALAAIKFLMSYAHTGIFNNTFTYVRLQAKLKEALRDLNIMSGRVGLHVLRHGGATYLLNNGLPLKELSEFMGHESISQTEVYAKILASRLHDVVSNIG